MPREAGDARLPSTHAPLAVYRRVPRSCSRYSGIAIAIATSQDHPRGRDTGIPMFEKSKLAQAATAFQIMTARLVRIAPDVQVDSIKNRPNAGKSRLTSGHEPELEHIDIFNNIGR